MPKLATSRTITESAQAAVDCVRYEELVDKWRSAAPTSDEIEWYAAHETSCRTGIHLAKDLGGVWDLEPTALLRTLEKPADALEPRSAAERAARASDGRAPLQHAALEQEVCDRVWEALSSAGALERNCDYILPCGLHSDTHVNVGKVCESEASLDQLSQAYATSLAGLDFDALLTTGWAMATVGRRLLSILSPTRASSIQHVIVEGYRPPALLGRLRPGARVVVLLDVVVSGGLAREIVRAVHAQGGAVQRVIALVAAEGAAPQQASEAFCKVQMNLADPRDCLRCGRLAPMEFNPVAYRMTQRKSERSVSQFLDEHPEVSEMWELVLRADAFNRHRTIGARHYPGFIDTAQLLAKEAIRADLVARLCAHTVARAGTVPTAVLVPDRRTARLLGGSLVEQLQTTHKPGGVELTVVRRRAGSPLVFPSGVAERLRGRDVVVVDAATAYGDTLDDLSLLASQAGARLVTAAVLVSRLTEPGEAALDARLSGGFVRLFAFAVRPIRSSCADCQRLEDLRRAAGRLSAGPARELAIRLTKRPRRFAAPSIETEPARQLELFSDEPPPGRHRCILTWCPPRIAAAVTSNAVHAARGDGMAPLSIPEIFDLEIPTGNKVAMVEALPRHSLVWNGEPLRSQLFDYLDRGREPDVWLAIAGLLAREGHADWIERLSGVLDRSASWLSPEFWIRTQIVALELAQSGPRAAVEGEARIRNVMAAHPKVPALAGLEAMIDTMRDAAPESTRRMS